MFGTYQKLDANQVKSKTAVLKCDPSVQHVFLWLYALCFGCVPGVSSLMSLFCYPLWALYDWWNSYCGKVWGGKDTQSMQTNEYKWEISLLFHFQPFSLDFQTAVWSVTAQCLRRHCRLAGLTLLTKHWHFHDQQLVPKEKLNWCFHSNIKHVALIWLLFGCNLSLGHHIKVWFYLLRISSVSNGWKTETCFYFLQRFDCCNSFFFFTCLNQSSAVRPVFRTSDVL